MPPSLGPQPCQRCYSVRHQARLDAETHAKLQVLAASFHRKRSAILRFAMPWGLRHSAGWTIDRSPVIAVPPVPLLLDPELLQQVQDAATAHDASVAAWLRHAVRHIRLNEFPASWRAGETGPRSHDSRFYGQRFMLRLDEITARKQQHLVDQFGKPRAAIIRQLIAQATPEQFPPSLQLAVRERRA